MLLVPPGGDRLVAPPLVVVQHRVDGLSWWQAVLGALALVGVAYGLASLLVARRPEGIIFHSDGRTSATRIEGDAEMPLGWLASGTIVGATCAFVLAPFTGQADLMPAAVILAVGSLVVSSLSDAGLTYSYRRSGPPLE